MTEELGSEVNVLFGIDVPPLALEETKAAGGETADEASFLLEGPPRAILCAVWTLGRARGRAGQ